MIMKKRMLSLTLAVMLILCLFSGCGGSNTGSTGGNTGAENGSAEGKVLNIYVWNDEFQGKFNANYPEVKELSNDRSITYLNDGTEIHWIINPNQDGVYQQKLDEALAKQSSASADEKIDMFLVEADYALKYIDPDVDVAIPISELGITAEDISRQYKYTQEAVTTADGEIRALSY